MSRSLIVNADDFGFTSDVNEGIVEAHRNGILTATTLMANGNAFDHAVRLARETPSLDIGCHLVFIQGQSVSDPSRALPRTPWELVQAMTRGNFPLYKEAVAQIRRIRKAGIQPSHIDTHKHTHLLPPILDTVAGVAREFGIRWVRQPFDFGVDPETPLLKGALAMGLRVLRPRFASALRELRHTDHFTGFQMTGRLDEQRLLDTILRLPEGLTELMCHPGKAGAELRTAPTRLRESRAIELSALTSAAVRQALQYHQIILVDYAGSSHVPLS